MTDIPKFFDGFLALPPEKVEVKPPRPRGKVFTHRDWEVLQAIVHMQRDGYQPTNGQLAKVLDIGLGAVSARVKRLATLGLISIGYENSSDTGAVNRRYITIQEIPPEPWEG